MTFDKPFFFNLNKDDKRLAEHTGLPTRYEAIPRDNSDKVEVWYGHEGQERYSLYTKDMVTEKLEKGIWIKEEKDTHVLIEAEFGDI